MQEEKKYYLTPKGLQKYKKEYEELQKLRKEKKDQLQESRDEIWRPEDLNPEFETLKTELDFIESKIKDIEKVLKNVKVVKNHFSKKVTIGTKVVVEVEGEKDEFIIVGTMEANPSKGKISNESPVGKALMNHKVGDEVVITSPIKTVYKIKKIK